MVDVWPDKHTDARPQDSEDIGGVGESPLHNQYLALMQAPDGHNQKDSDKSSEPPDIADDGQNAEFQNVPYTDLLRQAQLLAQGGRVDESAKVYELLVKRADTMYDETSPDLMAKAQRALRAGRKLTSMDGTLGDEKMSEDDRIFYHRAILHDIAVMYEQVRIRREYSLVLDKAGRDENATNWLSDADRKSAQLPVNLIEEEHELLDRDLKTITNQARNAELKKAADEIARVISETCQNTRSEGNRVIEQQTQDGSVKIAIDSCGQTKAVFLESPEGDSVFIGRNADGHSISVASASDGVSGGMLFDPKTNKLVSVNVRDNDDAEVSRFDDAGRLVSSRVDYTNGAFEHIDFVDGHLKTKILKDENGKTTNIEFDKEGTATIDGKPAESFDVVFMKQEGEHLEFDDAGKLLYVKSSGSDGTGKIEYESGVRRKETFNASDGSRASSLFDSAGAIDRMEGENDQIKTYLDFDKGVIVDMGVNPNEEVNI
jgi:hypothetical protein